MEAVEAKTQSRPPEAEQAACCAASSSPGSRRWSWIGGAALVIGLALYAGWDWLAATGVAAVLVALGPCLAMCALGLCMRHGKAKQPAALADIRRMYETPGDPPSRG